MAVNAVDSLRDGDLAEALTRDNIDAWLDGASGLSVVLFAGVSKGRAEGHDAAVALRECKRTYGDAFQLGVATDADEAKLMNRFRAVVLPSVVFIVGGDVAQVMPRLRDWAEYDEAFRSYLGAPPVARP